MSPRQRQKANTSPETESDQMGGGMQKIKDASEPCVDRYHSENYERDRMADGGIATERETMQTNHDTTTESWTESRRMPMEDQPGDFVWIQRADGLRIPQATHNGGDKKNPTRYKPWMQRNANRWTNKSNVPTDST